MDEQQAHPVRIPLRALGSLNLPAILIGMWQVAGGHGKVNMPKAVEEMKRYANAGFLAFDMADIYGPAEEIYGRFLKDYEHSKLIYGITKFVPRPGPMSQSVVEASIDQSRKKMGVQVLDMVQFHWWDYNDERYLDATRALNQLKHEGKIREVALTNFDTIHMAKIVSSGCSIVSNQVIYSIIDTRPEKKMIPWCLENNVRLLAYGSLLGGFFSNRYLGKPEPKRAELNTSSLAKYKYSIDQWGNWALFQELLLVLKHISEKHGVSISNVAVRYIADKPAVGGVIIGARLSISEHIASNLQTFNFTSLDEEDMALIHGVVSKGRALPGDCGDEYRFMR
eukprot:c24944_g1_i1 orf=84-1097(+)